MYKIKRKRRETGLIEPEPHRGGQPPALHESPGAPGQQLKQLLDEHPDATESELIEMIGVSMSTSTMGRAIQNSGACEKKTLQAAEQDRPKVKAQRTRWTRKRQQFDASVLYVSMNPRATRP